MELPETRHEKWMDDALCRGSNPDLFHPFSEKTVDGKRQIKIAKAVCELCPVKSDCLEYALNHEEKQGVWGGTSADERQKISRRRRLAAIGMIPDQGQLTDVV